MHQQLKASDTSSLGPHPPNGAAQAARVHVGNITPASAEIVFQEDVSGTDTRSPADLGKLLLSQAADRQKRKLRRHALEA